MVSSVGNGTSTGTSLAPLLQQASVSEPETTAQSNAPQTTQPGVTVSISPEGASAAHNDADATTEPAQSDTVSPVKAFAYGALGLERPDQPHDQRNAFYTAGKWLAAGITIGGLISLLA